MWHKVAPLLARDYTVVAAYLRSYGQSSKPASTPDHLPYPERVMALDHPERVNRLAVMDIIPTGEAFRRTNMAFALGFWHWFFLAQPYDLPERMISANPENYYFRKGRDRFAHEALADYLEAVRNPDTVHAMCEDYRADVIIDTQLDEADRGKRKITSPTLVLWSLQGELEKWYDVLDVWRIWAEDAR